MSARMRKLLILVTLAAASSFPQTAALTQARELYQKTNYAEALRILAAIPSKDAAARLLAGKCHYMNGDFKKATEAVEQALALAPNSPEQYLWLGRAYGRRAETSSFVTAPGLASKARTNFEKAVALDPGNKDAVSDLLEYYLEAPGFLGGGLDKALALAEKMKGRDASEYEYLLARISDKKKDYGGAEEHLRRAVELAPGQAGKIVELAKFLARQRKFQESDEAFARALRMAPDEAGVIFERAKTYVQSKRNLDAAQEILTRYLSLPLTPDDAPRGEAEQLLKRAKSG
jgi:tetratricopeptide (TPR) repeat protein